MLKEILYITDNLRYPNNSILAAEHKKDLRAVLLKVKEEPSTKDYFKFFFLLPAS